MLKELLCFYQFPFTRNIAKSNTQFASCIFESESTCIIEMFDYECRGLFCLYVYMHNAEGVFIPCIFWKCVAQFKMLHTNRFYIDCINPTFKPNDPQTFQHFGIYVFTFSNSFGHCKLIRSRRVSFTGLLLSTYALIGNNINTIYFDE